MQLVIGSIVRAHGVRGEVIVYVTTDEPEDRFVAGSVLSTDPATAGPLTIENIRVHTSAGAERLLIAFEGVDDRDAAERLRGTKLLFDAADVAPTDDPDEFHDFQLVGLAVEIAPGFQPGAEPVDGIDPAPGPRPAAGDKIGEVVRVVHGPGGDTLVVARPGGRQTILPFVMAIVPVVDLAAGRILITPPDGLLDL